MSVEYKVFICIQVLNLSFPLSAYYVLNALHCLLIYMEKLSYFMLGCQLNLLNCLKAVLTL